jgi:hypothetical protein
LNKFTITAKQVIDVWRHLDPRRNSLVKLKTKAAAKQLRKEIKTEMGQIRFNNRGNSNSGIIPIEILAMELRKIDQWAAQYYSICCEAWELQGNKKSAALVLTIYSHFLRKLFAIRKASVAHEAERSACRTGSFDSIARLRIESFNRSADRLTRDWAEKIEIEALELEARARIETSRNQIQQRAETGPASPAGIESAILLRSEGSSLGGQIQIPLAMSVVSKTVREGKTVDELYRSLKTVRNLYRDNGWTASQIRNSTLRELEVLWEWIDRIKPAGPRSVFLDVCEWEDGDPFIFRQIATLYSNAPHLPKKPSWSTVRDWRKAYRGYERHRTPNGRRSRL